MNKYKVQINGESVTGLSDYELEKQGGLHDAEYTFNIQCTEKDMVTLEGLLRRVNSECDDVIFNYLIQAK